MSYVRLEEKTFREAQEESVLEGPEELGDNQQKALF